jgi:hypothetical protein
MSFLFPPELNERWPWQVSRRLLYVCDRLPLAPTAQRARIAAKGLRVMKRIPNLPGQSQVATGYWSTLAARAPVLLRSDTCVEVILRRVGGRPVSDEQLQDAIGELPTGGEG